tara:strand:+ start:338 stop:1282 length:945 start_codon:yes stop_codon:yes gene_type:complete
MKPNVLCTAPFLEYKNAINILNKNTNLILKEYEPYENVIKIIPKIHGFIPNARIKIDRNLIRRAKNLKVIYQPSLGRDHIDEEACKESKITVRGLVDEDVLRKKLWTTSEHAVGLILNLLKRQTESINAVTNFGIWRNTDFIGNDLRNKIVGIIGYGNVGSKVDKLLKPFGVKVFKCDPYIEQKDSSFVSISDIFKFCNIVTIHVPLTSETKNMINKKYLNKFENGWLINTSRGPVINEDDLIESLKNGNLLGAALDVINNESVFGVKELKIVKYAKTVNNLLITPHIGGSTSEYLDKIFTFSSKKLIQMMSKD